MYAWHIVCSCSFRGPWPWYKVIVGRQRQTFSVEWSRQLSKQQDKYYICNNDGRPFFFFIHVTQTLKTCVWLDHLSVFLSSFFSFFLEPTCWRLVVFARKGDGGEMEADCLLHWRQRIRFLWHRAYSVVLPCLGEKRALAILNLFVRVSVC